MSALPQAPKLQSSSHQLLPLSVADLDQVLSIEHSAYSHPWSRGNFEDSMNSGYLFQGVFIEGQLFGYFVLMPGVDEAHLLNITVAPAQQGRVWHVTCWTPCHCGQWQKVFNGFGLRCAPATSTLKMFTTITALYGSVAAPVITRPVGSMVNEKTHW